MPNPRDQRLQQLMAIAQLYQTMQGGQNNQQQNALAQMGLAQQGQHQQAQIQQQQAALEQARLAMEQQGQFHQGELQNQQSAQALAERQGNAQLAEQSKYHQGTLDAQKGDSTNRMNLEFMQHFLPDPNIPWEQKISALQTLAPQFTPMGQAMHESGVNSMVQKRTPEVQAMYGQYNSGHDYKKLSQGLAALQGTMPQEVWNRQPWDELNSGMTEASSTYPMSYLGAEGRNRPGQIAHDWFVPPQPVRDEFNRKGNAQIEGYKKFFKDLFGGQ